MTISLIIMAAYFLDRLIGDPRWLPHPVIGMGHAISALEKAIRRQVSSDRGLKRAGILLPFLVAGGSFAVAWGLLRLLAWIHPWLSVGAEIVLIATTIASKGLKDAGMAVYRQLQAG
ncbi:cobalamin biosynthesis protein cobD, partial [Paenibacillus sp. Aloe-11]